MSIYKRKYVFFYISTKNYIFIFKVYLYIKKFKEKIIMFKIIFKINKVMFKIMFI